jgi:hypothetical protein
MPRYGNTIFRKAPKFADTTEQEDAEVDYRPSFSMRKADRSDAI